MSDIERWTLQRSTAHGVTVTAAPNDGTYGIPRGEVVEVIRSSVYEQAVQAERDLCEMVLEADQGDWDREVPTMAQYARARLRELGAVAERSVK